MNPILRLTVLLVAAALFAGGAYFAYQKMQEPVVQEPDPTQLGRAPEFNLPSHTGERFSSEELAGKVWAVNFIFTTCRGMCPALTARMEELAQALEPHSGWALISISVDPEHDTPEVLSAYRAERGIDSPHWQFLTGTREEVRALIRDGFKLPVQDNPQNEREPILHSSRMVLLDGDGNFRGFYDALEEDDMQGIQKDAVRLLK